jgi:hypothetical protein
MRTIALAGSRYLALLFAIGLAIGEAVINWGNWQYAPLWIVDYIIAAWLILGFVKTRHGSAIHVLLSGWAFTAGVFYMALFLSLDSATGIPADPALLILIGVMLGLSILGFLGALGSVGREA